MPELNQSTRAFYHPLNGTASPWSGPAAYAQSGFVGGALAGLGDSITMQGARKGFQAGRTDNLSVAKFNSSGLVAAWSDAASQQGVARVGFVTSAGDVTYGASGVFCASSVANISVIRMTNTAVLVAYSNEDGGGIGSCRVGLITGSQIAWGPEYTFQNGGCTTLAACPLEDGRAALFYRDGGDNGYGRARILGISSTSITFGDPFAFMGTGNLGVNYISVAKLSDTKLVVAYSDAQDSGHGTAKVAVIDDLVITFGPESEFLYSPYYATATNIALVAPDAQTVVACYSNSLASQRLYASVGKINGNIITWGEPQKHPYAVFSVTEKTALAIDPQTVVVGFRSSDNSPTFTLKLEGTAVEWSLATNLHYLNTINSIQLASFNTSGLLYMYSDRGPGSGMYQYATLARGPALTSSANTLSASGVADVTISFLGMLPTSGGAALELERGYSVRIGTSSIALSGVGTTQCQWLASNHPPVAEWLGAINDGSYHLGMLHFTRSDGLWYLRLNLDASGWVLTDPLAGPNPALVQNSAPRIRVLSGHVVSRVDDAAMWLGSPLMSDLQVTDLGKLYFQDRKPLSDYELYYSHVASGDISAIVYGPAPISRDITLAMKSDDLPLETEAVVFYHPADGAMEYEQKQNWTGPYQLVSGVVGTAFGPDVGSRMEMIPSPSGFPFTMPDTNVSTAATAKIVAITDTLAASAYVEEDDGTKAKLSFLRRDNDGVVEIPVSGATITNLSVLPVPLGISLLEYNPTTTSGTLIVTAAERYGSYYVMASVISFSGTNILGSGVNLLYRQNAFAVSGHPMTSCVEYGDSWYPAPFAVWSSGGIHHVVRPYATRGPSVNYPQGYVIIEVSGLTATAKSHWQFHQFMPGYSDRTGGQHFGMAPLESGYVLAAYNMQRPKWLNMVAGKYNPANYQIEWGTPNRMPGIAATTDFDWAWIDRNNGLLMGIAGGANDVGTRHLLYKTTPSGFYPVQTSNGGAIQRELPLYGSYTSVGMSMLGRQTSLIEPVASGMFLTGMYWTAGSHFGVTLGWTSGDGVVWQTATPADVYPMDGTTTSKCEVVRYLGGDTVLFGGFKGNTGTTFRIAIGTISGVIPGTTSGTINWFSPQELTDDLTNGQRVHVIAINPNKFLMAYALVGAAADYRLRVCTIGTSGAVTFGSPVTVNTGYAYGGDGSHAMVLMDAAVGGDSGVAKAVSFTADATVSGPGLSARQVTVSGTTVSLGDNVGCISGTVYDVSAVAVSGSDIFWLVNRQYTTDSAYVAGVLRLQGTSGVVVASGAGLNVPVDWSSYKRWSACPKLAVSGNHICGLYAPSMPNSMGGVYAQHYTWDGVQLTRTRHGQVDFAAFSNYLHISRIKDDCFLVSYSPVSPADTTNIYCRLAVMGRVTNRSLGRVEFGPVTEVPNRQDMGPAGAATMMNDRVGIMISISGTTPWIHALGVDIPGTGIIVRSEEPFLTVNPTRAFELAASPSRKTAVAGWWHRESTAAGTPQTGQAAWFKFNASGAMVAPQDVYRRASGTNTVMTCAWMSGVAQEGSTFRLDRGYKVEFHNSHIKFGTNTVAWSGGAVQSLLSQINDGQKHFVVTRFAHEGDGNWRLFASVDGSGWTDYGIQASGTQPLASGETMPGVSILPDNNGVPDGSADEIVYWAANDMSNLDALDLSKMYHLGATYDLTLDHFGAEGRVPASGSAPLFLHGPWAFPHWSGAIFHQTFQIDDAGLLHDNVTGRGWGWVPDGSYASVSGMRGGSGAALVETSDVSFLDTVPTRAEQIRVSGASSLTAAIWWKLNRRSNITDDSLRIGRDNAYFTVYAENGGFAIKRFRPVLTIGGQQVIFDYADFPATAMREFDLVLLDARITDGVVSGCISVDGSSWVSVGSGIMSAPSDQSFQNHIDASLSQVVRRTYEVDEGIFWANTPRFTDADIKALNMGAPPWYVEWSVPMFVQTPWTSSDLPLYIERPGDRSSAPAFIFSSVRVAGNTPLLLPKSYGLPSGTADLFLYNIPPTHIFRHRFESKVEDLVNQAWSGSVTPGRLIADQSLVSPSGSAYPRALDYEKKTFAWTFWMRSPLDEGATLRMGRTHTLTISTSGVWFDDVHWWEDAAFTRYFEGDKSLLDTVYDGQEHYYQIVAENAGGMAWRLLISIDGCEYEEFETHFGETDVSEESAPFVELIGGGPATSVDDVNMYGGVDVPVAYTPRDKGNGDIPLVLPVTSQLVSRSIRLFFAQPPADDGMWIGEFVKTADFYPQVLGRFGPEVLPDYSVEINVWRLDAEGVTPIELAQSGCYPIGDTGRWGWSTANMPSGVAGEQFYFQMTNEANDDVFDGQFFIRKHGDNRRIPRDLSVVTHRITRGV